MDVGRLRMLRELADRGTVALAADAVGMTASAVSQQLKILAREAGVQLVEPDGRRLRLTAAGEALVVRADEVLAALSRARSEMDSYRGTARGRVRLAMFPSGASLLLPGVLQRVDQLAVDIEASDVNEPVDAVPGLLADYDVILSHRPDNAPVPVDPRVHFEALMREPIDLVMASDHRLAGQSVIKLADVADEKWISVRPGFVADEVLKSIAAATGVRPRIAQRINDFQVTSALVAAGCGIALMPRYVQRASSLVSKDLEGIRSARVYEMAVRPSAMTQPAIAAVVAALRVEARHKTRATDAIRSNV